MLSLIAGYNAVVTGLAVGSLPKVFIDGEAGTTGLQVLGRLQGRKDLELITLPEDKRKDVTARAEAINSADAVILCLPDEAAIEAVALTSPDNDRTAFIDASTAHRTNPDWVYGFPELCSGHRDLVAKSKRIANPGCYPTGFISCTRPLVQAGLLKPSAQLVVSAVSGYSGGGKPLIGIYEGEDAHEPWGAYGFNLNHKHLPEMAKYAQLDASPIFLPAVGSFAQGMVVSVPIHYDQDLESAAASEGNVGARLHAALEKHYAGARFVKVIPFAEGGINAGNLERGAFLRPDSLNDTNQVCAASELHPHARALVSGLPSLPRGLSACAIRPLRSLTPCAPCSLSACAAGNLCVLQRGAADVRARRTPRQSRQGGERRGSAEPQPSPRTG